MRAGGGGVSPLGWWEKSILGLGIGLEQHLEGGHRQTLPPSTHGSIAAPTLPVTSVRTPARCCLGGDRRVPSSRGPRPPRLCSLLRRGKRAAAFAWEGRVKTPNNNNEIPLNQQYFSEANSSMHQRCFPMWLCLRRAREREGISTSNTAFPPRTADAKTLGGGKKILLPACFPLPRKRTSPTSRVLPSAQGFH